jgi:PAS domain S-box-containing protein
MPHRQRSGLPGWLSRRAIAWTGATLAGAVLAVVAAFLWYEHREIERHELRSSEMLARVIEDHANRTFDTVDLTLATLAEALTPDATRADPAGAGRALAQAQRGMPFLRSLSVVNAAGEVLASSDTRNVGATVAARKLPLPVETAVDRLGSLVLGRDLADAAAPPVGSSHSFVPLVRRVGPPAADALYLVAALNPDFFANAYELTLADRDRAAALLGIDGTLLAATGNIQLAPGSSAARHAFFTRFLPARESGSYVGPGLDGAPVLTAFRTLRKRALAVIVECDHARVDAEFRRIAGWLVGACTIALLLIGVMVALGWRSLGSHAAVQLALQATRDRVATSERDLRTLVESVQELIFRTDPEGRITFVNARWTQITGRLESSAIGRRLSELCVPTGQPEVDALFGPQPGGYGPGTLTVQIVDARGAARTLEVSVAAVHGRDGAVEGFAGFAIDVTERQRARAELESQLAFTAGLLEVSPTPLFVKDREGRFVTVNHAWLDLMGLSADAVIGRDSIELFGADVQTHAQSDRALLTTEQRVRYENRLTRPDGEARDTVVTKVRFTQADGRPAGIVGSIIDVTEFREAERHTREAQAAAERANRAKSEFIANISHELRTPLQAIIGFSELGAELAGAQPELHEMFGDIQAGGQRMLRLVNGLLDVSKMDSSVGSLALQRRDVVELVDAVVRELRPIAAGRALAIEVPRPAAELPADVDAFRMQQVIRNVLANAIRYAPEGSRIEVDCRAADALGTVELVVRDHGPGIPPDELETIFDAFVQSSRTSDGSGGTGLGLTICRKIMSAHGGRISAANAPGGGAAIHITLPPPSTLPPAALAEPALFSETCC